MQFKDDDYEIPDDFTIYNFPFEIWYIVPEWEVIVKISAFIPLLIFGLFGNILLLTIIIKNRSLRTPTNLIIANMATADLATLLICPVMFLVDDFYQNYELGVIGCTLEGFIEGSLLITAVLNLCAVSYDRLTAIVLPTETRLTIYGAKIVMLSTWIIGLTLAIPLAVYRTYKERQWKNFLETYCTENRVILPVYWHVLISALVWFPLAVMVICYSAIFYKLERYEKQVLKREHPISISYKTKVAKMLFIVVVIFILLRVPFTAFVFFRTELLKRAEINSFAGSFRTLWFVSHYLLFLNSAINPLIYGLTNDNFRRAYNQTAMYRCLCKSDGKIDMISKQQLNKNTNKINQNNKYNKKQQHKSAMEHQQFHKNIKQENKGHIVARFWMLLSKDKNLIDCDANVNVLTTSNNNVNSNNITNNTNNTKITNITNFKNPTNSKEINTKIAMIYDGDISGGGGGGGGGIVGMNGNGNNNVGDDNDDQKFYD